MERRLTRQTAGLLAIGLVLAGFAVMYGLGIRNGSEAWSMAGLVVTALGALAVVLRF